MSIVLPTHGQDPWDTQLNAALTQLDSQSSGTLKATQNLLDLADIVAARANLGLGAAATLQVGTTAGTVAAGDDARPRTPLAHAASHATGGTDAITAGSINAVPTTRLISTGAGLTGGSNLNANLTLGLDFTQVLQSMSGAQRFWVGTAFPQATDGAQDGDLLIIVTTSG